MFRRLMLGLTLAGLLSTAPIMGTSPDEHYALCGIVWWTESPYGVFYCEVQFDPPDSEASQMAWDEFADPYEETVTALEDYGTHYCETIGYWHGVIVSNVSYDGYHNTMGDIECSPY